MAVSPSLSYSDFSSNLKSSGTNSSIEDIAAVDKEAQTLSVESNFDDFTRLIFNWDKEFSVAFWIIGQGIFIKSIINMIYSCYKYLN